MKTRLVYPLFPLLITLISSYAMAIDPENPLSSEAVTEIIESAADRIRETYVFAERGERVGAELRKRLADGDYFNETPAKLAKAVSRDLLAFSEDKHMRLYWTDPAEAAMESGPARSPQAENFGIHKVELLEGNVRYLELREFHSLETARPYVEAAIRLLSTGEAIIFDLRKNGGGDPATVNLIFSYFMEPGIEYITFLDRDGTRQGSFSTRADLNGERLLEVPVYVLVSERTFSGGEELAYNFKTFKRGLLVGETTGGGANPGDLHKLGAGFELFVPTGRPVNPVTGTNWEGVGVEPDVAVEGAQALLKALELIRESND